MTQQQQLIPMEAGERLRFERKLQNLSITEVADRLHIAEHVLEALEADDIDRFAAIYQRGYLLAYARFLGISEQDVNELLLSVTTVEPDLETVFPLASHNQPADRWLRATGYVLASLVVGTLAWQFTHEAVRLSQGKSQLQAVSAETSPGDVASGHENERETHVNASIAALENIGPPSGSRTGSAGEQAWAALARAGRQETLEEGQHLLDLRSSADSWVEIRDSRGRLLEQDLVRGGSSRRYQGFPPFQITFGRSSAIELLLDGQAVDLQPFTRDDVTQMSLQARFDPQVSDPGTPAE